MKNAVVLVIVLALAGFGIFFATMDKETQKPTSSEEKVETIQDKKKAIRESFTKTQKPQPKEEPVVSSEPKKVAEQTETKEEVKEKEPEKETFQQSMMKMRRKYNLEFYADLFDHFNLSGDKKENFLNYLDKETDAFAQASMLLMDGKLSVDEIMAKQDELFAGPKQSLGEIFNEEEMSEVNEFRQNIMLDKRASLYGNYLDKLGVNEEVKEELGEELKKLLRSQDANNIHPGPDGITRRQVENYKKIYGDAKPGEKAYMEATVKNMEESISPLKTAAKSKLSPEQYNKLVDMLEAPIRMMKGSGVGAVPPAS